MNRIKNFFLKHPNIIVGIISALFGFVTALFANQVSSIIYNIVPSYSYVNDQGMFYYMGELLVLGKTPYIDFFDHKGPYIFYYTALGVLLGGRIGMMIVQTITFGIFYYFLIKVMTLFKLRKAVMLIPLFFIFALITASGQSPSDFEINFPFVMASIYFYLKAIRGDHEERNFIIGNLLIGITAGISIHLRATDVMVSLGMVIYYGVRQIIQKKYKAIPINALVCVGGIALASALPLIHSFTGHFTGMMYEACILNNFKYIANSNADTLRYSLSVRLMVAGLAIVIATLLVTYKFRRKISLDALLFYSITIGFSLVIQFAIANYPHYLIIVFPIILAFFAEIFSVTTFKKPVLIVTNIVLGLATLFPCIYFPINHYNVQFKKDEAINNYIRETISKEDRLEGKTLCYQTSSAFYINNDIVVSYGDFAVQINHMPLSQKYSFEKLKEYVLSVNCKYLIIDKEYAGDYFIDWLKNESNLKLIESNSLGSKYISVYTK